MSHEWLSIVPPIVAILLAVVTRRIVPSLLAAVFIGALIWRRGQPVATVQAFFEDLLWTSLSDGDHLRVFAFTLLMGAMIGVIGASGGMQDLVNRMAPLARGRRGGQFLTWLLGLVIFIDDYANTLLLGTTMRPLADRLRISREKLAYLVDSTAAPVSGLALISTWVAGEIGYIRDGFAQVDRAGLPVDGFAIFIETIPYRFYVLYALAFVPIVALLNRDFRGMRLAERRAQLAAAETAQEPNPREMANPDLATASKGTWLDAVVPVLVTVITTVILLWLTGQASLRDAAVPRAATGSLWRQSVDVIGAGNSYVALVYGSLAGLMISWAMATWRGRLNLRQLSEAAQHGARQVVPALLILWLAWALSALTDNERLGTGLFLGSLLTDAFDVRWMPTVVFVIASCVAFSTGTSWGTMGVLMPLVIPVTHRMLSAEGAIASPDAPMMLAAIGSVLAGAIFGDHCSPISDTTVLSSQASGCNHLDHVWTQLPYALAVACVAIVCGTLPVGFGWGPGLPLAAGVLTLFAVLIVFGRSSAVSPSGVEEKEN